MASDRWREVEELCHAALARPVHERGAFLAEVCTDDPSLRHEVESLVANEGAAAEFMRLPAAVMAGPLGLDLATGPLTGRRLGSYTIESLLGVGGMGEVYRAHDHTLGREVAIKVLPSAFTADPERRARFEREARTLASFNHPHIGAIYGVEEADGIRALVLELVEGQTLAERIAIAGAGGLPAGEALGIARQIANALDAAHEKGFVHRDLKPANIKITPDGAVKVLDFGLAKAAIVDNASPDLTKMDQRAILGTTAYMSPEQARGKTVDKRADIWAFGCIVYEMLTGNPPFAGETASDTIGKILEREPDWSALPAATSTRVRHLLLRCLEKDPRQRLRDIGDARVEIEAIDVLAGSSGEPPAAFPGKAELTSRWLDAHRAPRLRRVLPWAVAAALALTLAATVPRFPSLEVPARPLPLRLTVDLGADVPLSPLGLQYGNAVTISPDGSTLVFTARRTPESPQQLFVRRLDRARATALPGTEEANAPFFSPDSQWIAFDTGMQLKKVAVTGGAPVVLAGAVSARGGAWGEDDRLVFAPSQTRKVRLMRVPSSGGTPEPISTPGEGEAIHSWPQLLPGARAVLYTSTRVSGAYNDANLIVQALPAGLPRVLLRGGYHGQYVRSGHILYMHDGTLHALPFDPTRLEVVGPAVPVVEGVASNAITGGVQVSVSDNGTLVYLSGPSLGGGTPFDLVDRRGTSIALGSTPVNWFNPAFAGDGRLALEIRDGPSEPGDIWLHQPGQEALQRLTTDPAFDGKPVWTSDGRRVAFSSDRDDGSTPNLYWQLADGSGTAQRLTTSRNAQQPGSWHPSGRFLAFEELTTATMRDIMILPMNGNDTSGWTPGTPFMFARSPQMDWEPRFSPDGRWLAYTSAESGRFEVYVRPFPGPGPAVQVSSGGGELPVWSLTRREILYGSDGTLMVVSFSNAGDQFTVGAPREWSARRYQTRGRNRMFDLHPDGEHVFMAVDPMPARGGRQTTVQFVFNFFEELRRLAPGPLR